MRRTRAPGAEQANEISPRTLRPGRIRARTRGLFDGLDVRGSQRIDPAVAGLPSYRNQQEPGNDQRNGAGSIRLHRRLRMEALSFCHLAGLQSKRPDRVAIRQPA